MYQIYSHHDFTFFPKCLYYGSTFGTVQQWSLNSLLDSTKDGLKKCDFTEFPFLFFLWCIKILIVTPLHIIYDTIIQNNALKANISSMDSSLQKVD